MTKGCEWLIKPNKSLQIDYKKAMEEQTCSAREHPGGELVCLVGFFLGRIDLKENR